MPAPNEVKLIISADGSGAIAASKQVADAYKTLGAQTVADLNAQKAQITAAYETIKASGVASAEEIKHAEQAKNQQISQLNEDLVGKSQSWTSQIKAHWIGLAAGIGSAMMAINKGTEFFELGAKALQTESAFKGVAASANESAEKLLAAWQKASAGTVTATELMQRGIKGMTQGLSGSDMTKVWEMARQGAITAGMDVKTAGEEITNSIANNLPRAMVRFGLITKEQMQLIQKAMASGVEDVHMLDIAYDNFLIKQQKIGPEVDKTNEALQRHRKTIEELKESVGVGLVNAFAKFIEYVRPWILGLSMDLDKIGGTMTALMAMRAKVGQLNPFSAESRAGYAESEKYWTEQNKMYQQRYEKSQKALAAITGGAKGEEAYPPGGAGATGDPVEKLKKDLASLQTSANAKGMRELRQAFEAWKVTIDNLNPQLLETDKRLNSINKEAQKFIEGKPGAAPGTTIAIPAPEVEAQVSRAEGFLQQEALIKNAQMNAKMQEEGVKQQEQEAKEYETLYNQVAGSRVNSEEVAIAKIRTDEEKLLARAAELYLKDTWDYVNATRMKTMTAEQYYALVTKIHEDADRKDLEQTSRNAVANAEVANKQQLEAINFQKGMGRISPAEANKEAIESNQALLASEQKSLADMEAAGEKGDAAYIQLEEKIKSVKKAIDDLTIANREYTGTVSEGFTKGMQDYQNSITAFRAGDEIAKAVTGSMEKSFMTFFDHTSKGFMNFHDLAVSLLNDIERALIKALLVQPLTASITGAMTGTSTTSSLGPLGGLVSVIGGLFGLSGFSSTGNETGTPTAASTGEVQMGTTSGDESLMLWHEGGPIQRLHSGGHALQLKAGEVPIIAKAGEFMLRRSAADALGPSVLHVLNQGKLPGGTHISVPVSVHGARVSHADISRLRTSIEDVCDDWARKRL